MWARSPHIFRPTNASLFSLQVLASPSFPLACVPQNGVGPCFSFLFHPRSHLPPVSRHTFIGNRCRRRLPPIVRSNQSEWTAPFFFPPKLRAHSRLFPSFPSFRIGRRRPTLLERRAVVLFNSLSSTYNAHVTLPDSRHPSLVS